jgi:stage II sporulation protein R
MKNTVFTAFCLLLCTLLTIIIPTEADAAIYDDTIRLHILAPSDSVDDQALKLKIRDKILGEFSETIGSAETKEAAKAALSMILGDIKDCTEEEISAEGYDYGVSVTLTEEWYPTRIYGAFSLPSGTYTSLKIILGEGEGSNWWCVMYPPLCLDAALSESTLLTPEEKFLITDNGYCIKFKLLEVASVIFDKSK